MRNPQHNGPTEKLGIGHEPIVLVQNEVTIDPQYENWQDETGKQYHFPNAYVNLIAEGKPFVYYRGTRRIGDQRKTPEYFGSGTIGTIAPDPTIRGDGPKRNRKWFATIRNYVAFEAPVPFQLNGQYLENRRGREWGRPRRLPQDTYELILDIGGLPPFAHVTIPDSLSLPRIEEVEIALAPPGTTIVRTMKSRPSVGSPGRSGARRSVRSQIAGRRAEEIALKYLRSTLSPGEQATLAWIADLGEKPGWDIQYRDPAGALVGVEVKGSAGSIFESVDVTANEWFAAERMQEKYLLILVANCLGPKPILEVFPNPALLLARHSISLIPVVYRIEFVSAVH
jgi:hypothetical protein